MLQDVLRPALQNVQAKKRNGINFKPSLLMGITAYEKSLIKPFVASQETV